MKMNNLLIPLSTEIQAQQQRLENFLWDNADNLSDDYVSRRVEGMERTLADLLHQQEQGVEIYVSF